MTAFPLTRVAPVGATVTLDGDSYKVGLLDGNRVWLTDHGFLVNDNMLSSALTALWRMQQERDGLQAEVARLWEDAERWRAVRYRMTTETVFIGTEHTRFSACYTGRHESLEALADRIRAAQGGA